MGVVWEAYHKGVPLLGVPENPIDHVIAEFGSQDLHEKPPLVVFCFSRRDRKTLSTLLLPLRPLGGDPFGEYIS